MTLRIGVVGTGVMGQEHVRRLANVPDAEVVAISDVNAEQAKRVAETVGARALSDGHDLIGSDEVDAVLIASPGFTHEEFTLACVAADKPVLCEKPLAPTVHACLRVLEAEAARARRLVQVGFMRRYDGFRAMKQTLASGQIGRALLLHCRHRNVVAPPGFTSDMMITDSVVHDIDVTRWMLGQEIVAATVFKPRPSSKARRGCRTRSWSHWRPPRACSSTSRASSTASSAMTSATSWSGRRERPPSASWLGSTSGSRAATTGRSRLTSASGSATPISASCRRGSRAR
jgi:predicted dehydrogenase